MKKFIYIYFLLLATTQLATAQQAATATGTVKDDKGNPVPYAFVRDRPYKYATYTDSVGDFKLKVVPNSSLLVVCNGYDGVQLNTGTNTDFQVALKANSSSAAAGSNEKAAPAFKTNVFQTHNTADAGNQNFSYGDGAVFAAPKKEATHGSKYLFNDWVHGFVINPADSVVVNLNYLYNYDKMDGGLIVTQDKTTAVKVDDKQFKSFSLVDNQGNEYTFEKVPSIDNNHYVQVLTAGAKYKIYKTITTHLQKADYSTNGIASSGNNYDSYVDDYKYYVLNMQNNKLQPFTLRKKSLKAVFAAEPDKVNKYLTDHSGDIDDTYLTDLGSYMNE